MRVCACEAKTLSVCASDVRLCHDFLLLNSISALVILARVLTKARSVTFSSSIVVSVSSSIIVVISTISIISTISPIASYVTTAVVSVISRALNATAKKY